MKHIRIAAGLLCVVALFAPTVSAQAPPAQVNFTLDAGATSIHWSLVSNIHTSHGTFKLTGGAFQLDTATGNASGLITVDATSGESQNSARDSRMHKEVLESAKFPTITFRPSHIEGKFEPTTTGTFKVDGILNVHGQDHPMQLTVDVHPQGAGIGMTTKFKIPFVKWGMKDPSIPIFRVEKEVTIQIDGLAAIK